MYSLHIILASSTHMLMWSLMMSHGEDSTVIQVEIKTIEMSTDLSQAQSANHTQCMVVTHQSN